MVVDDRGRAYVGSYGFEIPASSRCRNGCLVLVEPTGTASLVATGLEFPNRCLVNANRRRRVLAETFGRRPTAFDIFDDGWLGTRTPFTHLSEICPDGLCQDPDGGIWVAAAEPPEFVRVLEGGTVKHCVRTPGRQAVACQLGGPDRRTLFWLTADGAFEDVVGCKATVQVEIVQVGRSRATSVRKRAKRG